MSLRIGWFACALTCALVLNAVSLATPDGFAASQSYVLGRADAHLGNHTGLEVNLTLSGTENDCQTANNGQFCLRYAVSSGDRPLFSGHGLIPAADVTVTSTMVTMNVNIFSVHQVTHSSASDRPGANGFLSITWQIGRAALPVVSGGQTSTLLPATVSGSVLGYRLRGDELHGTVVLYAGTSRHSHSHRFVRSLGQ